MNKEQESKEAMAKEVGMEAMAGCAKAIWATLLGIPGVMITGWCAAVAWSWFAVPMGAVPLSVATAIGLNLLVMLVLGFMRNNTDGKNLADRKVTAEWCGWQCVKLLILSECWIIHHFFM